MKNLVMLIPNLAKAGFKLWETSKEWNAKKRIAIFAIIPASLIIFSLGSLACWSGVRTVSRADTHRHDDSHIRLNVITGLLNGGFFLGKCNLNPLNRSVNI